MRQVAYHFLDRNDILQLAFSSKAVPMPTALLEQCSLPAEAPDYPHFPSPSSTLGSNQVAWEVLVYIGLFYGQI